MTEDDTIVEIVSTGTRSPVQKQQRAVIHIWLIALPTVCPSLPPGNRLFQLGPKIISRDWNEFILSIVAVIRVFKAHPVYAQTGPIAPGH